MSSPAKPGPFTVVSFHAHPDDEALLTAGTLARAATEGHRVIIVVATNGEAGLAADGSRADLGRIRRAELRAAAAAIGAQAVHFLGYPDTGFNPRQPAAAPTSPTFATIDPEAPAQRLAEILLAEQAHVLTSYDPSGGTATRIMSRSTVSARSPLVRPAPRCSWRPR